MQNLLNTLEPHFVGGVKIILRLFLYVALILFLIFVMLCITFPYPLDYGEAPLVDQARQVLAGDTIYRPDISSPPYTITNYPPLYMVLLAPFSNLTDSPFVIGRLISTLSALASALFLGLLIHTISKDRFAAIVTALLFLAIPYVVYWSGLLRIDLLALALSTAGLYVLVRWPDRSAGIVGGAVLLVLAAYTRQSYALAAPLAGFAWLWTQHRNRVALYTGLVAGLGLLLFLLLNLITGGGFFFNTIQANVNSFSSERLLDNLMGLGLTLPILIVLALIFLVAARKSVQTWSLLSAYLVGAILSALTVGKIGSNVNYFLELAAALSLIGGAFIVWNQTHPWRYGVVVLLLALQTGLLLQTTMTDFVDERLNFRLSEESAIMDLSFIIGDTEGPILADEYMGLLTDHNRPLYIQPFEVTQLARADVWDQTPLLTSIENQEFPLILYYSPWAEERWTEEMVAAITQNYTPDLTKAGTVVYRPRGQALASFIETPSQAETISADQVEIERVEEISEASALQPSIAVSASNPEHLAAIVSTIEGGSERLLLLTSLDGGQSWSEQSPFTGQGSTMSEGSVAFGGTNQLYVFGVRNGALTINRGRSTNGYEMTLANQREVTRGNLPVRPWLQIQPSTGNLFISYAGQHRDREFAAVTIQKSEDDGENWSRVIRADQYVSWIDVMTGQATPPSDFQVMFGQDSNIALAWRWNVLPWTWPVGVWFAPSEEGGENFATPTLITESWGGINTASHNGNYYLLYRVGIESEQQLALAVSQDNGQTWTASIASGSVPLTFDVGKAPGLAIAPNGTIDVVFYAHTDPGDACVLDVEQWRQSLGGWTDSCTYDVYYTFSQDGGQRFSEPLKLNSTPISGADFAMVGGVSSAGSHIGMASSDDWAYPIWIGTGDGQPKAFVAAVRR